MRLGPGGVAQEQAEHDAVGDETHALAGGQQDALGDADGAEAVGVASLGGGVEVGVEVEGPAAEPGARVGGHDCATGLITLTGQHGVGGRERGVAQARDERVEDAVGNRHRAGVRADIAQLAAEDLAFIAEFLAGQVVGVRQELVFLQSLCKLEADIRLGQGRALEGAITESEEIKSHAPPPCRRGRPSAAPEA